MWGARAGFTTAPKTLTILSNLQDRKAEIINTWKFENVVDLLKHCFSDNGKEGFKACKSLVSSKEWLLIHENDVYD